MKPNDPGQLNRKITLLKPTETRSAAGALKTSYSTLATVWANVSLRHGDVKTEDEISRNEQIGYFVIRYRSGITRDHRITYKGDTYKIRSIREEGINNYLEIKAEYID